MDIKTFLQYLKLNYSFEELRILLNLHKSKFLIYLQDLIKTPNITKEDYRLIKNFINNNFVFNNYSNNSSFIVIADLHFGHRKEKLYYLDSVYNYAVKQDIKDIYIVGDLLDGQFFISKKNLNSYEKQFMHLINNYPYDKSIHNYALLGNHDYWFEEKGRILINEELEKERIDFTTMGYKRAYITALGSSIAYKHLMDNYKIKLPAYTPCIQFKGHSHKYRFRVKNDKKPYRFNVPHLFKYPSTELTNYTHPGFLLVKFEKIDDSLNLFNIALNVFNSKKIYKKEEENILIKRKYPY